MLTVSIILLVVALVCFLIAAVNHPTIPARFNLVALGLAFWVLSMLVTGLKLT
jgi:hypothetical protein